MVMTKRPKASNPEGKREKIIRLLHDKDMDARDFPKNGVTRQARSYHIPELIKEKLVRSYEKDGHVYYSLIKHYEQPQDIIKLIEKMKSNDQAVKTFESLCISRNLGHRGYVHTMDGSKFIVHDALDAEIVKNTSKKYAGILSAGLNPHELKERLAFTLTYIKDTGEIWKEGQSERWSI